MYLHWPRVFHSLIVLSRDADTICLLSAENATLSTSLVWPTNLLVVLPLHKYMNCIGNCYKMTKMTYELRSHSRRVPSQEPDSANWASSDITTSDTKLL